MKITALQSKMARAALGLGIRELADLARVSPDTVARFERGEELKDRTVEALQRVLETAGVEFTNGGQPGVRMRSRSALEPLRVVSSSIQSVRLRTSDGKFPITIVIERSAIEDRLRLTSSTVQERREIVEANLPLIATIAEERYRQRNFTTGESNGTKFLQLVLRESDLSELELPDH